MHSPKLMIERSATDSALILNDKNIRLALTSHLKRMTATPKAVLEEVRVHNGNAIADVVSIHHQPHCYEIKGNNDNLSRALKQSSYYDQTFKKNTLVTTDKFIARATKIMPAHWGLIAAKVYEQQIKLIHIRTAKPSPLFNKEIALLTLWKSELLQAETFSPKIKISKLNREDLSRLIATKESETTILQFIAERLYAREINRQTTQTYRSCED